SGSRSRSFAHAARFGSLARLTGHGPPGRLGAQSAVTNIIEFSGSGRTGCFVGALSGEFVSDAHDNLVFGKGEAESRRAGPPRRSEAARISSASGRSEIDRRFLAVTAALDLV